MSRALRRSQEKAARRVAKPQRERGYFPKPLDEWEQFDSVERFFSQLRNGEVEVEGNHIVIMGLHGQKYAVLPALDGWMEYWATLAKQKNIAYDDSAMRRLAKSLEYDKPLNEAEIEAAYQVLTAQRTMFRTIDRREIAKVAIEVKHDIQRTDEIKDLMRAAA